MICIEKPQLTFNKELLLEACKNGLDVVQLYLREQHPGDMDEEGSQTFVHCLRASPLPDQICRIASGEFRCMCVVTMLQIWREFDHQPSAQMIIQKASGAYVFMKRDTARSSSLSSWPESRLRTLRWWCSFPVPDVNATP